MLNCFFGYKEVLLILYILIDFKVIEIYKKVILNKLIFLIDQRFPSGNHIDLSNIKP